MIEEQILDEDEIFSIPLALKPIIFRTGPKFVVIYISFDKNSIKYTFK